MCLGRISIDNRDLYFIIIDAGSTGSRGFCYHSFVAAMTNERRLEAFGLGKIKPGISSFIENTSHAADGIIKLLATADVFIPTEYWDRTHLFVRGTAGMRLLSRDVQDWVWDCICDQLKVRDYHGFLFDRSTISSLSGDMEAYYGVVAANYVGGIIDADLKYVKNNLLSR